MTERSRDERKKIFAEMMESLNEYSTEEINDHESAKTEILQLLKTHRPVKLCDREYGLSRSLKKDHRLIIKEPEDGSKVREYLKLGNFWHCSLRASPRCKCNASCLYITNGIVFAPMNHNEFCKTKEYSFAMEVQNLLKQGKVKEAYGLTIHGRRLGKLRSSSSSSTTSNDLVSAADHHITSPFLDESFSPNRTINSSLSPTVLERLSSNHSTPTSTHIRSNVKREVGETVSQITGSNIKREAKNEDDDADDDCCILEDEPAAKKPKIEEPSNNQFEFYRPSSFDLKQICKKLTISNKNNAYQNGYNFWRDIVFYNILSVANNVQTHPFKSPNLFASLSLLFTGKPISCCLIQHVINDAFCEDHTICGTKTSAEIEQILINGTGSDEQIEFIAKFLGCRIGIYYGKALKKFGKWDQKEEDALTLILSFDAGLYSVVLNLD